MRSDGSSHERERKASMRGFSRLRLKKIPVKWRKKLPTGTVLRRKEYGRPMLFVPSNLDVLDLVGKYFRAKRNGDRIVFEPVE